jgi:C-terminal processing protease CtpA/Prc
MKARNLLVLLIAVALAACSGTAATPTPQAGQFEPAVIQNDEGGPVTIIGDVAYTNPFFTETVAEPLVILEDQAGFVDRDRGYLMPPASQVVGQITSDFFTSPFSYSISLPIEPAGGLRDVDEDGKTDTGVMVFAAAYWTNTFGSPTLEQRDLGGGGWSTAYASTKTSEEAATEREYTGGKIIVYAPDDQQGFPSAFGTDGKLFTEDDPIVGIPQGYTMVDMDTDPFTFDRSKQVTMDLLEPKGAALDDFSAMSYVDAFDAMLAMMRKEYAFTELKHMDWDALNAEFRPRFQAATDELAYDLAMRDFTWSIPDGHVGITTDVPALNTQFSADTAGGIGFAIRETDDGRVIVNFLTPDGLAEQAGIKLGAQITEINGTPIADAISAVVPWSSPFSTEHTRRLQQLRYVTRFPADSQVEVGFQNPGGAATTATLATSAERDSFSFSSFSAGLTGAELPVEFKILDNGYGYAAIYSFFDNDVLTVQLWERMIKLMIDSDVPGLIIDLRSNGGGNGFLADQMAAYFFDKQVDLGTDAAWDESIQDFYVDPNTPELMYPPSKDLRFHGKVAVLVSPNCSSACEFFAYDMTQQDRALIAGQYPTGGLAGSVKDFNMPGGISVRFPFVRHLDKDGNIILEGVGVVPTVRVPVNEETLFSTGDPILEAAVVALDTPLGTGVPSGPPTVNTDFDALAELQGGTPLLDDLVKEKYTDGQLQAPGTLTYTVVLSESKDVIAGFLWCTTTSAILEENWAKMHITLTLDGQEIPADSLKLQNLMSGTNPCNVLTVELSSWPMGKHIFTVNATFTDALNDGFGDYAAGTRTSEYTIYVEH